MMCHGTRPKLEDGMRCIVMLTAAGWVEDLSRSRPVGGLSTGGGQERLASREPHHTFRRRRHLTLRLGQAQ